MITIWIPSVVNVNNNGSGIRRTTLIVTNIMKVVGVILATYEVFSQPQPPALVLALCAFMMAGAQVSEDAVIGFASRMFGNTETTKREEKKK